MIHAPNGMHLTKLNETPKMKCNKRDFDLWWRDENTDSNSADAIGFGPSIYRSDRRWRMDQKILRSNMTFTLFTSFIFLILEKNLQKAKYVHIVRVGLFIPPSEIKISFVAFHFRCLIHFSHFHSIRSIDRLTEGSFHSCSHVLYLLAHVFSSKSIKIILQSMTVNVWSFGGQRVFLGFSVSFGLGF